MILMLVMVVPMKVVLMRGCIDGVDCSLRETDHDFEVMGEKKERQI